MPKLLDDALGAIGSLKHSQLTEAQFQALYGTGWILADGRACTGTRFAAITGATTVPDARGLVLRAKNNGRSDGSQNPDGDLALGAFQDHAFQTHGHNSSSSVSDPGHSHDSRYLNSFNGSQNGWAGSSGSWGGFQTSGSGTGISVSTSVSSPNSGNVHGSETRMRNLTTNIFIRVN